MKIKIIILALLLIPQISFAAFAAPWIATSSSQGWVSPNKINGVDQTARAISFIGSFFTATSTTATSTFAGNIVIGNGYTAPYLNGLLSTPTQVQLTNNVADLTSNLVLGNTDQGIYSTGGITMVNARSTGGLFGTYYGYLGFSGNNFAALTGLPPNSMVLNTTDGSIVQGATSANNASSTIAWAVGSGYVTANYDMVLRNITTQVSGASTGGLGLGTTTPSARLAIVASTTAPYPYFIIASTTNAVATQGAVFQVNNNGNVGIGTANPNYKLEINGSASTTALYLPNTTGANVGIIYKGTTPFIHDFKPVSNSGFNTFVGFDAGNLTMGSTTGGATFSSYNTAVGYQALKANTEGSYNTAEGFRSLYLNTTGSQNSAQGTYSLFSNTTGSSNSAQGYAPLYSNTTGGSNSAQGAFSLFNNTTGGSNSAQGAYSLFSNTTGSNNSAQGFQSLYSNTTGINNSAQGTYSLKLNTTGGNSSAQGFASLNSNTTGSSNSAQGAYSLHLNTTGNFNSAQGALSLFSNTTGSNNVAVGYQAGRFQADGATALTTTSNSIYIGEGARGFNNSDNNTIVIGNDAIGLGANTAVLGNSSITTTVLQGNVGIGTTTPYAKLSVTNTGTNPSFIVEDSTSPDSTPFIVDASGNVGIGTTTPESKFTVTSGASATTTIQHGTYGDATSKVCYNTKNSAGAIISYYFVGTTQVIENNACK